jgi:hypothetical protein
MTPLRTASRLSSLTRARTAQRAYPKRTRCSCLSLRHLARAPGSWSMPSVKRRRKVQGSGETFAAPYQRTEALREIMAQRGLAGILELSERGKASWVIGVLAASTVLSEQELQELLRLALAPIIAGKEEVHSYKNLIAGASGLSRASSMRRYFSACCRRWRKAAAISPVTTCSSTTTSRRRSST